VYSFFCLFIFLSKQIEKLKYNELFSYMIKKQTDTSISKNERKSSWFYLNDRAFERHGVKSNIGH
jgi:hypothetical protein